MNFKHIWIVFRKEMTDSFRDRKSVMTNILLPLILIPLIYFFMNMVMTGSHDELEKNFKIAIQTNESAQTAESFTKENIIGDNNIEIVNLTKEEAKQALKDGNINCVIVYSEGFFEKLNEGKISDIGIEYNSLKNSSSMGMQMLQTNLMALNQKLAAEKLTELGVSTDLLNLVNISTTDSSLEFNDGKNSNQFLMMIIPMYLAITIVTAGVPIAIDVIAGERERNTFEPLLSTKASRLSILIGKYLAVLVFSIIAIIMSFIGLILGIVMNPEMFSNGAEVMSVAEVFATMNMPIGSLLFTLLSSITLAVVFAGVQIAISTWSKSVKEAQTYLSYMTFPVMILAIATMYMGAGDMKMFMAFIPIFNTIASLKMVLAGVVDYAFLSLGVGVNIVFVILVTMIMVRMFKNEKMIIK